MSSKEKKAATAAEEAKKNRKFYRNCIIFVVVLAIVVVASAFITSDYFTTKTTAISIGGADYSPVEFNYYYRSAVSSTYAEFYNTYGDMASYLLNTSASLEEQTALYGDGSQSWAQYFYDQAIVNLTNVTVLYDSAIAEGYGLDDDVRASIDADVEYYRMSAVSYGYDSLDAFLAINFGKGFDEDTLRSIAEKQYIAAAYSADLEASLEYSEDEKESYYSENADTFDFISYHMYFVSTANSAFEDLEDEAKVAAAREAAERIADAASGAQFTKNVQSFVSDDSKASYADESSTLSIAQGGNLGSAYKDWLLDSGRAEGDTTVIDTESGSYAIMYVSRNDNHYKLADVRHILIKAEAGEDGTVSEEALDAAKAEAERIYALWQEDPTEDNFAALAEEYSQDDGSKTNGGLYEDVYKDYMVEEFNDFLFNRGSKPGDSAIVYGNNGSYEGYHVVYFSAEGELFSSRLADSAMRAEEYNEIVGAKAENYSVVIGSGMKHVDLA